MYKDISIAVLLKNDDRKVNGAGFEIIFTCGYGILIGKPFHNLFGINCIPVTCTAYIFLVSHALIKQCLGICCTEYIEILCCILIFLGCSKHFVYGNLVLFHIFPCKDNICAVCFNSGLCLGNRRCYTLIFRRIGFYANSDGICSTFGIFVNIRICFIVVSKVCYFSNNRIIRIIILILPLVKIVVFTYYRKFSFVTER